MPSHPRPDSEHSRRSALGLACNIDGRGRWARAALGGVLLLVAAALAVVGLGRSGVEAWGLWAGAAGAALGGIFCLFEAANGWCAARAMGIRTKL